MGRHSLLQGIFPAQGLNPSLPHCRQILYLLSHLGSPREILYPTNLPSPAVSTYWPSGVHLHLYLYQCFIATILIHILIIYYLDNYHCLLNDLSASNLTPFFSFQSILHTILRVFCHSNTSDLPVRRIITREAPLFKTPIGPSCPLTEPKPPNLCSRIEPLLF